MEHQSGVALFFPFLQHSLWDWVGHAPLQARGSKQVLRSYALNLGFARARDHKVGVFDSVIEDFMFSRVEELSQLVAEVEDSDVSAGNFTPAFRSAFQEWSDTREDVGIQAVWRAISTFDWLRKVSSL